MTVFDAYIFVDWSARSRLSPRRPSKDAIWVGELVASAECGETYWRGRERASMHVTERVLAHVEEGRRVLVGFDFPYGYPAGFASCLGNIEGRPWRDTWDLLAREVMDDERNRNNRFEVAARLNQRLGGGPGPFWGCHPAVSTRHLSGRQKGLFAYPFPGSAGQLERLRLTEQAMGGVQETWKLNGNGSVGSQALVGIPRVRALRDDPRLAGVSAVWPFETGFTPRPLQGHGLRVLHAEIWPGIISKEKVSEEAATPGVIRDQAQVRLMCQWALAQDEAGTLGPWFDATNLDERKRRAAVEEEGWILGCAA
jgi:hypothetical protein